MKRTSKRPGERPVPPPSEPAAPVAPPRPRTPEELAAATGGGPISQWDFGGY